MPGELDVPLSSLKLIPLPALPALPGEFFSPWRGVKLLIRFAGRLSLALGSCKL